MATWQAIHKGDYSKSDSRDRKLTEVQTICCCSCSSYWRRNAPPATFLNNIYTHANNNLHLPNEEKRPDALSWHKEGTSTVQHNSTYTFYIKYATLLHITFLCLYNYWYLIMAFRRPKHFAYLILKTSCDWCFLYYLLRIQHRIVLF